MNQLSPELLDLLEQIRQIALGFEGAEEYFPWGTRAFFREIKGRNFLFVNPQADYLEVIFRLPLGQKEKALTLPFVEQHKSMSNWLSARIHTQDELDALVPWLKVSYELSKPFRGKDEYLEGEPPQILAFLEQLRQAALGYGDIEEYFPFGDRAFRRKKGQIFIYAGEGDDHLYVNVRLPLGEREYALSLPYVEVPKYIGHRGWVGAKVRTQEEMEIVLSWIPLSYELNQPARKSKVKK